MLLKLKLKTFKKQSAQRRCVKKLNLFYIFKADENATRLGKFTIAGMLSGNSESQRQERISKLQVEIKEFEAAEKCAAKNLEALEEEAKDEILVND